MKVNFKQKNIKLFRKDQENNITKKSSETHIRPIIPTTNNIKAIVGIGYKNNKEIILQNPFIERQQVIAEKRKIK
jgi:hypothetical protein